MSIDNEEWRPVVGHEGLYEVSNHGRVRRLPFIGRGGYSYSLKYIVPSIGTGGYPFVGLRNKSGRNKAPRVHSLVAAAFLGERPKGMVVNHIDFNKQNNHVSNLEYVTNRENIQHSARHARHGGILTMEQVQALRSLASRDPGIDLDYIAKRLGVAVYVICNVLDATTYSLVPNKDGTLPVPLLYTHRKRTCVEDIKDFVALGFSIPQISKYYKLEYSTPYQMLNRAGVWQEQR